MINCSIKGKLDMMMEVPPDCVAGDFFRAGFDGKCTKESTESQWMITIRYRGPLYAHKQSAVACVFGVNFHRLLAIAESGTETTWKVSDPTEAILSGSTEGTGFNERIYEVVAYPEPTPAEQCGSTGKADPGDQNSLGDLEVRS